MGSKMLIVGCGAQGKMLSTYLARSDEVDQIELCDINLDECKRHAEWLGSDKVSVHRASANDVNELTKLANGTDIVINAVESIFNLFVIDAALRSGTHYVDLAFGPPYDNLQNAFERNDKFTDIGRTALTSIGASPGITNMLAAQASDKLDSVESIYVRSCDVIDATEPIYPWSPRTLIQDCMLNPVIIDNGEMSDVPPFSGEETYTYPDPAIGTQKIWYHIHEEPFMFAHTMKAKGLKKCNVKEGGLGRIKTLYDMGMLTTKPVKVRGVEVPSWELAASLLPTPPTGEDLKRMTESNIIADSHCVILVDVSGERNGVPERHTLWACAPSIREVMKKYPIATHSSFQISVTGSLAALKLVRKEINVTGVLTPEQLPRTTRQKLLDELGQQDPPLRLYERVESRFR